MIISSEIPQSSIPATFSFRCHPQPKSNTFPRLLPSFNLLDKFPSLLWRPHTQSQAGRPWEQQPLLFCSCSAKSKNVLVSTSSSHLSRCFVRHHLWVTGLWFTVLTKGSVDLPMWGTTGLTVPGQGGEIFWTYLNRVSSVTVFQVADSAAVSDKKAANPQGDQNFTMLL